MLSQQSILLAPRQQHCVRRGGALRCAANHPLRPGESAADAAQRRARESARVGERTKVRPRVARARWRAARINGAAADASLSPQFVTSREELDAAFSLSSDEELVIVTVQSEEECNLGSDPGAFNVNQPADACVALKDTLSRVARECENVSFVSLEGDASPAARALSAELGVTTFPTVQYYKAGKLLFQHAGAASAAGKVDESVAFLGSTGWDEHVSEVKGKEDLEGFLASCAAPAAAVRGMELWAPCDQQLGVLDVSTQDSPGCAHIFPAVLALAKNTAGAVRWARLLGDAGPQQKALIAELKVASVPSFIFFNPKTGKEFGRYTGADRGQLMAAVLEAQQITGYSLPSPPPRKRPSVAEAKRIASEARAREKAAGRQSGW